MSTILVLHGPNLPLLGMDAIDASLHARAAELGLQLRMVQANDEGGLIDALLAHRAALAAIIVNPGALAEGAWALAETLTLIGKPAAEVLLGLPTRGPSALASAVVHRCHGQGPRGYVTALEHLAEALPRTAAPTAPAGPPASVPGKSLGRRPKDAPPAQPRVEKSLGRRAAPPPTHAPTTPQGPEASHPAHDLTRAALRAKLTARLSGALGAEALAAWAREAWSALQRGEACEAGARSLLDGVLLTLMSGARASEHVLLAQLAKLE